MSTRHELAPVAPILTRCRPVRGTAAAGRALTAGLLAAAVLGGSLVAAGSAAPTAGDPASGFLVTTRDGQAAALAADLRGSGWTVTRQLDAVGVLAVQATGAAAQQLRSDPRVAGVSADRSVALQADSWSQATSEGSLTTVTSDVGARAAWAGGTGQGVDVALLDSGVTSVKGLDTAGKLLSGPDLSLDAPFPALRYLDGFGHGTHMAGIIAGRDASFSGPADRTSFAGVAPGARIVSVKVADAYGNADVSQIIAGIDWVVQHKKDPGMNIRVLNLSVGLPSQNGYETDPLAHAAEQAWLKGLVVVASAGNDGATDGRMLSPAYDPYVVAVGASDENDPINPWDDTVSDFSSRGSATRTPDVVAPGSSIASLRVPGSYLDQQYPSAVVGGRYFRGSGTSQAAAVVSGTAALLVQRNPGLTPDMVKGLLTGTASPLLAVPAAAQGKGKVKVSKAAITPALPSTQTWRRSTGSGSLDAARGGYRLELGGNVVSGERDVLGRAFSSTTHAAAAAAGTAWTGGSWNGATVAGTGFVNGSWATADWSRPEWAGYLSLLTRSSTTVAWDGRSWAGGYWNGRSWAGRSWAGRSWATGTWG